ncbi:transmembrane protein, putative [Medicago truncatula]|uniref:Transmembrane protein, putative n=1 Tax=Medicago truncatula TaxID=3880 RepID=G7IIB5_MEDTR|nr:transmembrane protein, putative [Medicago truncatula]
MAKFCGLTLRNKRYFYIFISPTLIVFPIGGDARRLCFWDPILERLRSRLSEWKSRNLSYGGQLPQDTESDVWLWRPNIGDGYTVRGMYQMLMRQEMHNYDIVSDAPWHKSAPLKVSICAWRLLHYLIIHCPIFGALWQQIKTWIGVFSVDPHQVLDHYYQFVYSSGGYAPRRSFLHLIWLCGIWVIWNKRNYRLFVNTAKTTEQLLEKVKITSLKWLKAKNVCFPFDYHLWWQHPLAGLGIG